MESRKLDFKIIEHMADLGILVYCQDLKGLFTEAAQAMMQIMIKSPCSTIKGTSTKVTIEGGDLSDLMVSWLGGILYLFADEKEVAINITTISISYIKATLKAISFDPAFHEVLYKIKAVSCYQIQVIKNTDKWEARIIFNL